jgi:hypothetical protein
MIDSSIQYPITVQWEDGEVTSYNNRAEMECTLEDFDSLSTPECTVTDASGSKLILVLDLMHLERLEREVD